MNDPKQTLDPRCARVRARLPELLDDALLPLEAARDRGHLEACAGCAAEEARELRLLAGVRALARVEPDELARVHAAVLAALPPRRAPARERLWLAAAAAAVLVALGSWFGPPAAPRTEELAGLDFFSALPDWSGLLRGLGDLTRPFS